ncbi:hypothetical protein FRC17_003800 [Serendipita sp. 399]|nr:hypothetical protein FRC17_003800 [Serendipita sp. 399]
MPAAPANCIDLQWAFFPGFDIRNSAVATRHWKTADMVDMYRFNTPEGAANETTLTKVLRLNYVSEQYELVAVIEWEEVVSESQVKFLTADATTTVSQLRQKHPERPNSWYDDSSRTLKRLLTIPRSRYFSAGDSHYKWGPGDRRKEDLMVCLPRSDALSRVIDKLCGQCVQTVFPNRDVCFYEGTTNRLRVTPEGQQVMDELIVTLLLNLYCRELNLW